MPTPWFICGAECGIAAAGTASSGTEHWSAVTGSPSIVTSGPSPMRSTRCFRFNGAPSQNYLSHTFATAIASPATVVARFYIYFDTFPAIDCAVFGTRHPVINGAFISYKQSDNTLRMCANSESAASGSVLGTVTTGVWYRVDVEMVFDTTQTIDACLNGVSAPQRSLGGMTASSATGFVIGMVNANTTCDFYMDDLIVSGIGGEYPIGEGSVVGLYPNADGVHGGTWATGAFKKGTSGATNASRTDTDIWQSLANPLSTSVGSTWVTNASVTTGYSTDYVRFAFDDMPDNTGVVNGVMMVVATHSASNTGNSLQVYYESGASAQAPFNGDFSESTITVPVASLTTYSWDKNSLNAMLVRFSGTDANPDVYLDGVCLEVDYVPSSAPGPTAPKRGKNYNRQLALTRGRF